MSDLRGEFDQHFRAIRRAAARGVGQAAATIRDEIKRNAPVETGALRDSTVVEKGRRTRTLVEDSAYVEGGHGDEPVPMHVEYGTADEAPNPFVRRSVNRSKKAAKDRIKLAILGGVDS